MINKGKRLITSVMSTLLSKANDQAMAKADSMKIQKLSDRSEQSRASRRIKDARERLHR